MRLLALLVFGMSSCTCKGTAGSNLSDVDAAPIRTEVSKKEWVWQEPFVASLARGSESDVWVFGKTKEGGFALALVSSDGTTKWIREVPKDKVKVDGAELTLLRSDAGPLVCFRTERSGKKRRVCQGFSLEGALLGAPFEASEGPCVYGSEGTWTRTTSTGLELVRRKGQAEAEVLARYGVGDEVTLACGESFPHALKMSEGDETVWPKLTQPTVSLFRNEKFSDEEEQRHSYTVGDAIGVLRVGSRGTLSFAEVDETKSPWVTLRTKLTDEDGISLVDAAHGFLHVVVVHEPEGGCSAGKEETIRVLSVDRKTRAEVVRTLGSVVCSEARTEFSLDHLGDEAVLSWFDRNQPGEAVHFVLLQNAEPAWTVREVRSTGHGLKLAGCSRAGCIAYFLHEGGTLGLTQFAAPVAGDPVQKRPER